MALNREQVVNGAWHILQEYGLGDLSMRRLAKDLGVQPGALYWHVANKQELLAALARRMVAPLEEPRGVPPAPRGPTPFPERSTDEVPSPQDTSPAFPGSTSPEDDAAHLTRRFRSLVLKVRDGADVISVAHALNPLDMPPAPQLITSLTSTGTPHRQAECTALTLIRFTLGSVTVQQTREAMNLPTPTSEEEFEAGLTTILA